jgi:glycosyltransferase involved in cell wall biosynthesis
MDNLKKVAIFTTFDGVQEAYSLNIVTQMQLKMLIMHGYKPIFIATRGFKAPEGSWYAHQDVEIRSYTPVAKANSTEGYKDADAFLKDVETMAGELETALQDVDVVITHEVIYQPDALKHRMAAVKVAMKKPEIVWLNWVHSATSPALLANVFKREGKFIKEDYVKITETSFLNGLVVYPNSYDVPRVAKIFGVNEPDVKVVNHPIDITKYFDPKLEQLIFDKGILNADFICTYPLRLDRGKQPEYVIKIMNALKKYGKTIRIIIADFHSTGGDKVDYRQQLKELGMKLGLTSDELIFLSDIWRSEAPQKVIFDLQSIGNVFILPSKSETYSLVAQEAMRFGNIMVMNQDFPALRSIYHEYPAYIKFSSVIDIRQEVAEMSTGTTDTKYSDEWEHWDWVARIILARYETDGSLLERNYIRQTKNLQAVFRTQLEPLINNQWHFRKKE